MARTIEQFEEQFQDYLEELKVAEYTRLNKVYTDIAKLLTSALNELERDISDMRRAQLEKFIRGVSVKQAKMLNKMIDSHIESLNDFAGYSYQIEATLMHSATGAAIANATKAKAVYQAALTRPLGATGDLLEPFIQNLTKSQVGVVEKTLRKAAINKWTTQETLQVLKGTKAANYTDGVMSRLGKQTATVVRTAMQHVNNSARQTLWADNPKVIRGYRWISTLDGRTSEICRDLDGEEFKIGDGPLPPAHPNCRSTTVAVLDKRFDVLLEGATRASADGYVPLNTTYPQWLAEQ